MVPARFEIRRDAAETLLRQGRPQGAEAHRADHRRRDRRGAGRPARRDRGEAAGGGQARAAAGRHSLRRGFLHRSRRPFAARRALRLGRARDAAPRLGHACRTFTRSARCARSRAHLDGQGAKLTRPGAISPSRRRRCCGVSCADWRRRPRCRSSSPSSPRNGSAFSSPISCITSADASLLEEVGRAARRLHVRQHRHGGRVDRRQMAGHRPHQAGALSAVGRLLLSAGGWRSA